LPRPPEVDNNLEGIAAELEADGAELSPREVRNIHMNQAGCSNCHALLDPMGFPFDRFEQAGLDREYYAGVRYKEGTRGEGRVVVPDEWDGETIDVAGAIVGSQSVDQQVANHVELVEALGAATEVKDCVAEHAYQYVNGVYGDEMNACELAEIQTAFRRSDGNLMQLFVETVTAAALAPRSEIVAP
ncbi:MAG: DUF1588 domain-containing protein, partial [Myxococcota bacterium]